MVNMLRYIALVAFFTGALGQFSSNATCEDMKEVLSETVTMDQIAGTWYEVGQVERAYPPLCKTITIGNVKGEDGKLNPQQKYEWNLPLSHPFYKENDRPIREGNIAQDKAGQFYYGQERYSHTLTQDDRPFTMVKIGADFTKLALKLSCISGHGPFYPSHEKSFVYIAMMSRTETVSDEDKKIFDEKLKTIPGLGSAYSSYHWCPLTLHKTIPIDSVVLVTPNGGIWY